MCSPNPTNPLYIYRPRSEGIMTAALIVHVVIVLLLKYKESVVQLC